MWRDLTAGHMMIVRDYAMQQVGAHGRPISSAAAHSATSMNQFRHFRPASSWITIKAPVLQTEIALGLLKDLEEDSAIQRYSPATSDILEIKAAAAVIYSAARSMILLRQAAEDAKGSALPIHQTSLHVLRIPYASSVRVSA